MNLRIEEIDKYDIIVRKKCPAAKMQKVDSMRLTWHDDNGRVATLTKRGNSAKFKFDRGW